MATAKKNLETLKAIIEKYPELADSELVDLESNPILMKVVCSRCRVGYALGETEETHVHAEDKWIDV